jgi:photosystem II stability/assembly factor-like uncharacterized protein
VSLFAPGAARADTAAPIRVSSPVQATKFDPVPTRQYGSPDLAVDPTNALDIVATMPNLPTKVCGLMRSTDGGVTWSRLDKSPALPSYPFCLQSGNTNVTEGLVAFGRNHTLYYLFSAWDTPDGDKNGAMFLGRSTDFGQSWSTTMVRDNRDKKNPQEYDRPISGLAVDTTSGSQDVVAVGWRWNPYMTSSPNDYPTEPLVSVSTDGGRTFPDATNLAALAFANDAQRTAAINSGTTTTTTASGATTTSTSTTVAGPTTTAAPTTTTTLDPNSRAAKPNQVANFGGANPTVAVDNKGNLYAAWVATYANIDQSPQFAHFLSKSTDHGKTWSTYQISPYSKNNTNGFNAMHLKWSPIGGPDGSLNFVYEGSDQPDISNLTQVFYRRSVDGGKTWSDRKLLSDQDATNPLYYNGDPNISVAPNGRIDVAFWDTRNDPGVFGNDVYYTSSSDGGVTWSKNIRVTDQLINRTIGVYANNYDVTSPPGVASANSYAIFGWDDSRNGDKVTNTQDIYVASVQYHTIKTGSSSGAKYVLAAVVGLCVVGLVLLALALMRRRQYA